MSSDFTYVFMSYLKVDYLFSVTNCTVLRRHISAGRVDDNLWKGNAAKSIQQRVDNEEEGRGQSDGSNMSGEL
jgi:hypothetical protein